MQPNERILKAIEAGDAAGLRQALADGGDPNLQVHGFPVLHVAAISGEPDLVEALLAVGADANAVDERAGRTAVMYLAFLNCRAEQTEALKRLLAAGAEVNRRHAGTGQTALDMAADWRNERSGQILLDAGAMATGHTGRCWSEKLQAARGRGMA